jgi:SRSO17 transposase
LRRLVRLAKPRWRVEQNYQQLTGELGLDHYEDRGRQGWYHHLTLVCVAYAFPLLEQRRLKKLHCRHCRKPAAVYKWY